MVAPEVEIRWTPFYPLPTFPHFKGELVPAKASHNIEDLLRLAKAYGLRFGRPSLEDPDWSIPHAAFLWADRQGKGAQMGLALMDARWAGSEDIATPASIAAAAEKVGLDPREATSASEDAALRTELTASVQQNFDERGLFGVPMFVLPDGKRFWGHDRMEWAIRDGYVPGRAG